MQCSSRRQKKTELIKNGGPLWCSGESLSQSQKLPLSNELFLYPCGERCVSAPRGFCNKASMGVSRWLCWLEDCAVHSPLVESVERRRIRRVQPTPCECPPLPKTLVLICRQEARWERPIIWIPMLMCRYKPGGILCLFISSGRGQRPHKLRSERTFSSVCCL